MPPDRAAPTIVRVQGLYKHYDTEAGAQPVLNNVDLIISEGDFVALMGPSGSGKTTLMNILGFLDTPSKGKYWLKDQDVSTLDPDRMSGLRNRFIGFVFQGFNLLPRVSLVDNVALPMIYARVSRGTRRARAIDLLRKVGLEQYADRMPNQISGGQQQRVAIARALANMPKLLLADEPTGNLDTHTSREIMQLLQQLNREEGLTVLLVTHEPDIARYASRLVNFVDGHVTYDGSADTFVRALETHTA